MQDKIINQIEDGKLLLKLSKEYYLREAVFETAYKFTDKCTILIEPVGDVHIGVFFEPKREMSLEDLNTIAMAFTNEVLDQQVRLDLEARNGRIRELIVRHAFSPVADLESEINA